MTSPSEYAVTFTAREQAELLRVDRDLAPPGPEEVLGRTLYTLVSAGTELEGAYMGASFPRVPGYAAVMEVEAVGAAVESLRPGEMAFCSGPHRSFQRVTANQALPIPAGLAPEEALFCRLMGVSMSTLTTTAARPPARVLVTGLGLVGHLAARVFQGCGYTVAACDPSPSRRRIAEENGIRNVFPAAPLEDPEWAGKVELVLECSGHEQAALQGCRIVRKKGEVVLIGAPWRRRTDLWAHDLLTLVFHRYVVLRSGWEWELPLHPADFRAGSIWGNYAAALQWLGEGRVSAQGLYALCPPERAQDAFQDLLHARLERLAVVFDWTQTGDEARSSLSRSPLL